MDKIIMKGKTSLKALINTYCKRLRALLSSRLATKDWLLPQATRDMMQLLWETDCLTVNYVTDSLLTATHVVKMPLCFVRVPRAPPPAPSPPPNCKQKSKFLKIEITSTLHFVDKGLGMSYSCKISVLPWEAAIAKMINPFPPRDSPFTSKIAWH